MTPVDNDNNFWQSRLKNAGVAAATFVALTGASGALGQMKSLAPELGFAAFGAELGAFDSFALQSTHPQAEPLSEVAKRFPQYSSAQLKLGRQAVESEMAPIRASSENGRTMSVLDKLNQSSLNQSQKERVLNALAAVRENYTNFRNQSGMDPDQQKNWIHTQGELGRILDSARDMKLTPNETEDALLASMFSDSVKTKANFMVHHVDGAAAAQTFLGRITDKELTPERLHGILEAIKEHQIGPPGFMSMIYSGNIRSAVEAERPLTASEDALIKTIAAKIADPFGQELVDTGEGGKSIQFEQNELDLLKRVGIDRWNVPDASTPWYKASRTLINGDSIDNYATPGGFSKIVGLNGPETDIYFKDPTIDVSLASPRRSFQQAYKIMTPEGQQLANNELDNTDAAIARAKGRVESWLRTEKGVKAADPMPEIPYWNKDLKYPDQGPDTNEWWKVQKIAPANRTPEQQKFWTEHRYDGLTPGQIGDFEFAKSIRDRLVDELRREQRLDGQLPPDFKPAMSVPGQ